MNELICVVWDDDHFRCVGRVTLGPGVGSHVVDVTDPAAPTLLASPEHDGGFDLTGLRRD